MTQFEIHINDPVAYEASDESLTDEELLARARQNLRVEGAEPELYIEEATAPEYDGERMVYAHHLVVEGDKNTNINAIVNERVTNNAHDGSSTVAIHVRPVSDFQHWSPSPEQILHRDSEAVEES